MKWFEHKTHDEASAYHFRLRAVLWERKGDKTRGPVVKQLILLDYIVQAMVLNTSIELQFTYQNLTFWKCTIQSFLECLYHHPVITKIHF